MKSRLIISRNACFNFKELKAGRVYRCEKFDGDKIEKGHFWHDAIVWVWSENYALEGIGKFCSGKVAAISNGTLFPNVQFDNEFRFLELPPQKTAITAVTCRNKACHFIKEI